MPLLLLYTHEGRNTNLIRQQQEEKKWTRRLDSCGVLVCRLQRCASGSNGASDAELMQAHDV